MYNSLERGQGGPDSSVFPRGKASAIRIAPGHMSLAHWSAHACRWEGCSAQRNLQHAAHWEDLTFCLS